ARACERYAAAREWDVVEVIEDVDLSAYKKNVRRPGYEHLRDLVDVHAIDGVVVWKLDRLVRRPHDFEDFWRRCEDADVALISVTEPIDTSDEFGLALVRILVTFASLESATHGLRARAAYRAAA